MSNRAVRLSAALGVAASLIVGLSACTPPGGDPRPATSAATGSSPIPTGSKSPEAAVETPAPTIEPVLVVAAVAFDGAHVTASGYVQGVIEDGGRCTFTFTRTGSAPVSVDHEGAADRLTTSCGTVQPDASRFARGTWSVTLGYTSGGRGYESAPVQLEVP